MALIPGESLRHHHENQGEAVRPVEIPRPSEEPPVQEEVSAAPVPVTEAPIIQPKPEVKEEKSVTRSAQKRHEDVEAAFEVSGENLTLDEASRMAEAVSADE